MHLPSATNVDLEAALRGDAPAALAAHNYGVFTAGRRLRASFVARQPPGPATLSEKFLWPHMDLQKFRDASINGLYGLGHFWQNLRRIWQTGLDMRTKYSGMGTAESGLDLLEQDRPMPIV